MTHKKYIYCHFSKFKISIKIKSKHQSSPHPGWFLRLQKFYICSPKYGVPAAAHTCSAPNSFHWCNRLPFITLWVVAFGSVVAVSAIIAPHSIQKTVQHSHADPNPPCQHRSHWLPFITLRLVPGGKKRCYIRYLFLLSYVVWTRMLIDSC